MKNVVEFVIKIKNLGEEALRKTRREFTSLGRTGSRALSDLQKASQTYHTTLRQLNGTISAFEAHMRSLIALVGGFNLAKSLLGTASEWETYRAQLTTAYRSTELAKQIFIDIENFASRTPFHVNELVEAWIKLKNMGLNPTLKMIETIGDATAALGGSRDIFNGIVLALGQMKAKGKVSAEELMQLAERGIPVFDILKEKLHLTGEEIQNIGNLGISADKAINAILEGMSERFGGQMKIMSSQLKGLWSTLLDNLKQFQAAVMESGPSAFIKGELQKVLKFFTTHADAIKKTARALGKTLVEVGKEIKNIIKDFASWFSHLGILGKIILAILPALTAFYIKIKLLRIAFVLIIGPLLSIYRQIIALKEALLATSFGTTLIEVQKLTASIGILRTALLGLRAAFTIVGSVAAAAFIGWELGKIIARIKIGKHTIGDWGAYFMSWIMRIVAWLKFLGRAFQAVITLNFDDIKKARQELEEELKLQAEIARLAMEGEKARQTGKQQYKNYKEQIEYENAIEKIKWTIREIEQEIVQLNQEKIQVYQEEKRVQEENLRILQRKKREIERSLKEAENLQQKYKEEIKRQNEEIVNIEQETQDAIRQIRRRTMTEEELEEDRRLEFREKLSEAESAWIMGELERAEKLAKEAFNVAQSFKDQEEAIDGVREASELLKTIHEELRAKAEESYEKQKQKAEELKKKLISLDKQIEKYKKSLEALDSKLKSLQEKKTITKIEADIKEAETKIKKLKSLLNSLQNKEITVKMALEKVEKITGHKTGGLVGFASGGKVPGYGGGDRVKALLEPGEFVVRKEAVRKYGLGFLQALNNLRLKLPAPQISLPRIAVQNEQPVVHRFEIKIEGATLTGWAEKDVLEAFARQMRRRKLCGGEAW